MDLPGHLSILVKPMFDALPLDRAMPDLVVRQPADQVVLKVVWGMVANPIISKSPELIAGLWLYVDYLEGSHKVSQSIASQTGSFWHAILHRREGDFDNALYWYRAAGHHPVMDRIPNYDPENLVEMVKSGDKAAIAIQRQEWARLFEWCALKT